MRFTLDSPMNHSPRESRNHWTVAPLPILVGLVPGPILIVILAICLIAFYATRSFLYLLVWTLWCP